MAPQTRPLPLVQPYLEEQQSALSPLLPNDRTEAEELLETPDRNARSTAELPGELDSTRDHLDGVIRPDNVEDVTHVGRWNNGIETAESNLSATLMLLSAPLLIVD